MYISTPTTETVNPKGCLYKLYILLQTFLLYLVCLSYCFAIFRPDRLVFSRNVRIKRYIEAVVIVW